MLTLWSAAAGCNNRMPMCIGSFSLHSKWIGLSKRDPNSSVLRRDVESDRLIGNSTSVASVGTPAPPWPSGSSVLPWLIGSPSSPQAPPPLAPPSSVGPLESSALTPPQILPPSAPPWATIMAVAWVLPGSSCTKSLLAPPSVWSPLDHPVSSLAPSSIVSTLDPVSRPPPGSPSSTKASTFTVFLPALHNYLFPSHVHSFVLLLSPPLSLPFLCGMRSRLPGGGKLNDV